MGHEPEVRRRILIAEGCDTSRQLHESGNGGTRSIAQSASIEHHAASIFHQSHVNVHARAGLARSDFRSKGHVHPHLISQVTDDPLSNHQFVGGLFYRHG